MVDDFSSLPDYMSPEKIRGLFNKVLDTFEHNEDVSLQDVIKSLFELAHRQWHTYTMLDDKTKSRVESLISNLLSQGDWAQMPVLVLRYVLSIIGNLGLVRSYDILLTLEKFEANQENKSEIQDFIRSINTHREGQIKDPFYNLRDR